MLTTLLDSNSRVDFCNSQTWKHADRIAPDKVQTGFDRIVEVKKRLKTAGFWLSRACLVQTRAMI